MEFSGKHILVCASFRTNGQPMGACEKKGASSLLSYLREELQDRGMTDVLVSATSCLNVCDRGPAMVVYPEGTWYGGISGEEDIDNILDSMEKNETNSSYLLE